MDKAPQSKAALLRRAAQLRRLASKIEDETARQLLFLTVAEYERRAADVEEGEPAPPELKPDASDPKREPK